MSTQPEAHAHIIDFVNIFSLERQTFIVMKDTILNITDVYSLSNSLFNRGGNLAIFL